MVKQTSWRCYLAVVLLSLLTLTLGVSAVKSRISGCDELVMPRLAERIRPTSYKLTLLTNLDDFSFKGFEQIYLEIGPNEETPAEDATDKSSQKAARGPMNDMERFYSRHFQGENTEKARGGLKANQIALHADAALVITGARYAELEANGKKENEIQVIKICHNKKYDLLVVTLERDLVAKTRARLQLSFVGPIRDDLKGFYRSSYLTPDSELRYAAVTQFEATDARRAFPCFDEPNFKATFELTLIHAPDRSALSNMPTAHEEDIEMNSIGWLDADETNEIEAAHKTMHLVRFKPTPPMSTYLLAWVVGEFEHLECNASNNRIKIRAHTEPGRKEQSHFALKTACRAVEVLENYFGIKLPLKKIDMVSLNDFDAGAMENWGLITFSDESFLVDEQHTSLMRKSHIASVVIHELAHQWFGNLVTMNWWNDLWLNEGFATWVQYNMTQTLFPEFDMDDQFVLSAHISALVQDEGSAARSIAPESLSDNTNFDYLFDAIAYEKSASMIRLLNHEHLGPKLFKSAIQLYLSKHLYGNTQTKDLWGAMELAGSQSVQRIMDSWVSQPGHPIVKVSLRPNANELALEQERITNSLKGLSKREQRQQWIIPIGVIVSDGFEKFEEVKVTMNGKYARLKLPSWFDPSQESGHWFKVNPNFAGFYRVKYQMDLMRLLRKPIESQTLSPIDRTEVISDAVVLFTTNRMPCDQFIEILSWYSHEDSGLVLVILADSFRRLNEIFSHHHEAADKLRAFGRHLFEQVYQKFGFIVDANTGPIDQNGRASALTKLIELDHSEATSDALKMFDTNVTPVLRPAVYMAVAKHGSDEQYERLFEMYEATHSREEHDRLVEAIFQATEGKRLDTAWNWLKRPEVKVEDKLTALQNALASEQGVRFVEHMFRHNSDVLMAFDRKNSMAQLARHLCVAMGSENLPKMDSFFSESGLFKIWGYWFSVIKSEFIRRELIQTHGDQRMLEMLDYFSQT